MMNFVAAQLISWVVHGPLIEASGAYPQKHGDRAERADVHAA